MDLVKLTHNFCQNAAELFASHTARRGIQTIKSQITQEQAFWLLDGNKEQLDAPSLMALNIILRQRGFANAEVLFNSYDASKQELTIKAKLDNTVDLG